MINQNRQSQKGGRGSNLSHEDRVRGGEHSHGGTGKTAQGQKSQEHLSQGAHTKGSAASSKK